MPRTLGEMFSPVDAGRLRFRGGWAALPVFLILTVMYPLSLDQAGWVGRSAHLVQVALLAVLFGTLLGNGKLPGGRALALGGGLGVIVVMLLTVLGAGDDPFRERAQLLGIDVNQWMTQVLAGEAAYGQTVFLLLLGGTVWAASFVGAFALARTGRVWEAILISGACLTINVSLALIPLLLDLVVFSMCALVLLVRLHIVSLRERWRSRNIQPAGEMDWRVLRGGLTWTAVLVIMALATPRVGAAETLTTALDAFEAPYNAVEAEWQRFFSGVTGPSRLRGVSFSDQIRLGLAPNLGDRVVMTVETSRGSFWRAVAYDFYTGQGWRLTEDRRVDSLATSYLLRQEVSATFDVDVTHANLLFGANEPVRANVPHQFITGVDRSFASSMRAIERRQAEQYVVTSSVSVADKTSLRQASTTYPEHIRDKYLQVPSSLPGRVGELARTITAGLDNPYDAAEAIESYLRTNYRYSTNVVAPPPGRDPVDFFLFDLEEDFCEYFASAMVMMLREVGVPARMVEGFTPGTFEPTSNRYLVRETNAHAWVEVYFPSYGWIEFEPTPSEPPFARADQPAPGVIASRGEQGFETDPIGGNLERDIALLEEELAPQEGATAAQPLDPRPALVALGALLLAMLLFLARFEWRFRGLGPIEKAWGKTALLGAYIGHPPSPAQTTYEYAESFSLAVPDAADPMRRIARARVRERYAAAGASDDEREAAEEAWWQVAREVLSLVPQRIVSALARLLPR